MGMSRSYQLGHQRQDGHETLKLLLQPPRILCASTGHNPQCHQEEPVQPTTARVPVSQGQLPQETTRGASGCCNIMLVSTAAGSPHIPIIITMPLPLPSLSEPKLLNQPLI